MASQYDPALCERLVAEAREERPDVKEWAGWVDDNLAAMADQLEAALREVDDIKSCLTRAHADANEAEALIESGPDWAEFHAARKLNEVGAKAIDALESIGEQAASRIAELESGLTEACDVLSVALTALQVETGGDWSGFVAREQKLRALIR